VAQVIAFRGLSVRAGRPKLMKKFVGQLLSCSRLQPAWRSRSVRPVVFSTPALVRHLGAQTRPWPVQRGASRPVWSQSGGL